MIEYKGIIHTIETTIELCSSFSTFLLPVAFITSIFTIIGNIVLIKKEGFSFKNMLGIILGISFYLIMLLPLLLNNILQSATWIDVHNQHGIALYIQNFLELTIYIIIAYLECILIGTIILGLKTAKHIPAFNKDFMIILGCKIKKDGTLTNLLKCRVDKALEFKDMQEHQTGKRLIFIPSGGQGKDEVISEASAIKNYLLEKGINNDDIIIEDKSKNTYENIKFSCKIISSKKKNANIAFSTTNYHVFRTGIIANDLNVNVEGIGAKTKTYFWINAFIREFIATLFSEKKKHIFVISLIIIIAVFMIIILYLSNIA